jgi:hypothetical protein
LPTLQVLGDEVLESRIVADLASIILELVLLAPFSVPYQLVEPEFAPPCGWSLVVPPFDGSALGYLEPARCDERLPTDRSDTPRRRSADNRTVAAQASLETLESLDGSYGRLQGRARLLTSYRLELDIAYSEYAGWTRSSPGGLGQAHAALRFAQSERAQFRVGAGIRHRFVDGSASEGFDALYAVDVFWPRHVATTLEVSGGTLGTSGWAFEVRPTVGYLIGPVEAYAGWDAVWLRSTSPQTEFLGGPVLGARAYF